MIKELRAKRAENFWSGGGPDCPWGGTEIFLDGGGQALMGGDGPFMGYGPPPSPPMLATPAKVDPILDGGALAPPPI